MKSPAATYKIWLQRGEEGCTPKGSYQKLIKTNQVNLAKLIERTLAVVGRLAEAVEHNTKALNRIEK